MRRRYHVLDVFTDTRLAGNPLAVVLDCDGLDDTAMQAIAREFNLSETVFVFASRDPVNFARLRIFTPARELPFAGHPTLGTAILLATLRAGDLIRGEEVGLVLEEAIGTIRCTVRHRRGEAPHGRFEVPRLAESAGIAPDIEPLAAMLGLAAADIGGGGHVATRFSAGNAMTFVPLVSRDALGRVRLGATDVPIMIYLYTPVETDSGTPVFRTRMLSNGYGVPEDPATGSAAAALPGALLANEHLADGAYDCFLHQGVEMGRPSRIGLAFSVEAGRLASTTIGGSAVLVAEGILDI